MATTKDNVSQKPPLLVPTRPEHKSLSWLNPADKKRVICQLHTEMINVSGWNLAADEEEDNDSEPPAKKPALTSEEDDFDLLFGQKEDSEAEGQVQSDDHLSICKMNWTDTLRKLKSISFRKDDPLLWWRNHETYFPTIAKLARKYLCIPASTAPSERVFSTAKNILQKKRWRILP